AAASGSRAGRLADTEEGEGVVAVALGPSVATIPLRPWAKEVKVMAPRLLRRKKLFPAPGGPSSHGRPAVEREEEEEEEEEALSLHGQVLAWSNDG
ncbi:unnamed protein product, partial [Ectocarpus sp. 12 AP-2014]